MAKTRRILAICLAVSAIATGIMIVNAIISPQTSSLPAIVCTGIVPVALCVALFSLKGDDAEK